MQSYKINVLDMMRARKYSTVNNHSTADVYAKLQRSTLIHWATQWYIELQSSKVIMQ